MSLIRKPKTRFCSEKCGPPTEEIYPYENDYDQARLRLLGEGWGGGGGGNP